MPELTIAFPSAEELQQRAKYFYGQQVVALNAHDKPYDEAASIYKRAFVADLISGPVYVARVFQVAICAICDERNCEPEDISEVALKRLMIERIASWGPRSMAEWMSRGPENTFVDGLCLCWDEGIAEVDSVPAFGHWHPSYRN